MNVQNALSFGDAVCRKLRFSAARPGCLILAARGQIDGLLCEEFLGILWLTMAMKILMKMRVWEMKLDVAAAAAVVDAV